MTYRWFRFHNEALNDHKIQMMPPEIFKAWVNILCIASKHDGKIRNDATLQFNLRMDVQETVKVLTYLTDHGLLDFKNRCFVPHNWDKWQYKSDVSTSRVKRFRERRRNVSETPPDTDSDTDTNKKEKKRLPVAEPPEFLDFWNSIPHREGANPRFPALKAYVAAINRGADPLQINAAAKLWNAETTAITPFVKTAVAWLNGRYYEEYHNEEGQGIKRAD